MPVEQSRSHAATVVSGIGIAIAVLLTLVSYFASVNEYVSAFGDEMAGAYDCDGPVVVLTFAAAGIFFGLLAIVGSGGAMRRSRRRSARAALGVAIIVVLVATARIVPTIYELRRNAAPDSPCH
ncbi:MAG TPA: hypothetical protein VEO54_29560 [Thermoanaerobaculia bacterium]|nr:hypothetical protein [Thermoanaerobaculia bacterium]